MTIRPWWLWGLGIIGVAIVALLALIAFALLSDDGGTSTELAQISRTATQCPDPTAALAQYQAQEACTAAKLAIELGDIADVDAGSEEQFFTKNCQGVVLLGGSPLGDLCAAAGLATGGDLGQTEALRAAALVGQYCRP